jgi:hypothetical protein
LTCVNVLFGRAQAAIHVRFWLVADIDGVISYVRFAPESGLGSAMDHPANSMSILGQSS